MTESPNITPLQIRRLLRLEQIIRTARSNGLSCVEQYDQNRLNDWFDEVHRAGG